MRGRQRYAATFTVEEYWRGRPARTVTLYDLSPGSDCLGSAFQAGKSYLVFASNATSDDYFLAADRFWYGWTDILTRGTPMYRPMTACMPGGDVSLPAVQKQIRELGTGSKPPA
jgi:hypothetical protein